MNIERNKYLNQLVKSMNNSFPKVITGIRRCGKSYLLNKIFRDYLLNIGINSDNILYINLDDDSNYLLRNPIELGRYVRSWVKDKESTYIFLDEIQKVFSIINPALTDGKIIKAKADDEEIISFVDVILGLSREKNIDLYVTGSNSKMLSSQIITEFRDKATNIMMQPLSFQEFYNFKGGSSYEDLNEYMIYGGMPLVVSKTEEDKREYLNNLFEATYLRDILEHNHINKSESLDELSRILSSSISQLVNSKTLADTFFSVKHENLTKETIEKYINFFKDAFIIKEATRYDIRGKREIGALKKYYFTDSGLRNARINFSHSDEGQLLENVIYNELIYKGYTVNVGVYDSFDKNIEGKTIRKTNEIDFYVKKGNTRMYIQIAANIDNEITKNRELRPYLKLKDQIRKVLVINKPIPEQYDENGFTIIGANEFLLKFI